MGFCRRMLVFTLVAVVTPAIAHENESQVLLAKIKQLPARVYQKLGIESREQLQGSTLGPPLEIFHVRLDRLETFQSDRDALELLVDTKRVLYPIQSGEEVHSSVILRHVRGAWKFASFGGHFVHILHPARENHRNRTEKDHDEYFLVNVPAMDLNYLGYKHDEKLYLVPVHKHDEVDDFVLHEAVPAAQVFMKLKPLASKYRSVDG